MFSKSLRFLSAFILLLSFFACSDDDPKPVDSQMKATVAGKAWVSDEAAMIQTSNFYRIRALAEDGSMINLRMFSITPGEYIIKDLPSYPYALNKALFIPADWQTSNDQIYTTDLFSSFASLGIQVPFTNIGGNITITEYQENNKLVSGKFKLVLLREKAEPDETGSIYDEVAIEGSFTRIPLIESPANSGSARLNGEDFNPSKITGGVAHENTGFHLLAPGKVITVTVPRNVVPGTYPIDRESWGTGFFDGLFKTEEGPPNNVTLYHSSSGTITITEHDRLTDRLAGTFSFSAAQEGVEETQYEITEGAFDVTYTGF